MPSDSIRGCQSVLKGLAGEAAPHARLVVKAGDKLLLLSALSVLRTLELNAQVLFEPFNCLGNAVDKRLDKLGGRRHRRRRSGWCR